VGSFLPALLLGVAFANIFKGIPIDANGVFQGTLLTLLNPYGLLGGVLFLVMFLVHGLLWLAVRAEGELRDRASAWASRLWMLLVLVAVTFLFASAWATSLLTNYLNNPALLIIVLLPLAGLYGIRHYLGQMRLWLAWGSSALTILGTAFFGVIGIYPALLPSTLDPAFSMTISNSASSPLTLKIMLTVALIFVPIVLLYQFWAYKTFSHTITEQELADHIF
jgi:cytochrome d ubiquinol oxidase subunit II